MKESFVIKGLGGEHTLAGEIPVRGAKNDALKILAASFLFRDTVTIENLPDIEDVSGMINLISNLGATVKRMNDRATIMPPERPKTIFDGELAKKMRASVVAIGPVLACGGEVSFPHPGGCVIGARPIDLFIRSFEQMGAVCEMDGEYYRVHTSSGRLRGADIFLDIASVTATETLLMAAVLAEGTTTINNAAMEPEIQNLASFLTACGAQITGIGTPTLIIKGGAPLVANGNVYRVIPDRIEAASFVILGALAGKEVRVTHCEPAHVRALTALLTRAGANLEISGDTITVRSSVRPYKAVDVRTHEYPGFPTDAQAPMTIFLTQAEGESLVFETMFEGRLAFTQDLLPMGADITMFDPHRVMVRGPRALTGRELEGPDLRAGLAYVIAGIIASRTTIVRNVRHIDRGYERIEERLRAIGVDITRVQE